MNNRIKIVTYENFPYGGAPANLLRYIALALSSSGMDVNVVLPTGNVYGNKIESKELRKGHVENVRYKHLGFTMHPCNFLGRFFDFIGGLFITPIHLFFSNLKTPFDVIISYNTHITRILHLVIFKFIFNKKLIIILPEFYEKPHSISLALIRWYDFYFGFKYLAKYADAYIPVSHYLKNYLEIELRISKPILVLPNLLNPEIFRIEQKVQFIQGKITIGYAGTPTRKDGVLDLINSFAILNKRYSNLHLLIIGDVIIGKSVIPQLKKCAIELGCNDNITFTGLVPFDAVPNLLNSCSILALTRPSGVFADAGFPSKLGEYFACKKPVLISAVGDIPLFLKNEEHAIITDPDDINSIVKGFEKIITNEELAERISENGYNWMNNNLNYKNISHKLFKFITKV
jgi:glycosyltransferase involved in cell wall biosynthesis